VIREEDVREAIAEMQGQKNPNANTCIKLAAYYIIQDHLTGQPAQVPKDYEPNLYSGADPDVINYDGDSEFAQLVRGKSQKDVMAVMDELMSTLHVMHPRLYDGVMNKIYQ
jgi:hypothetical protein